MPADLPSNLFHKFEHCSFGLCCSHVVLCVIIYWPPKYNNVFIRDFSEFLAEITPKYDCVFIVGDINIHKCCPHELISWSFLNVTDSFNCAVCV